MSRILMSFMLWYVLYKVSNKERLMFVCLAARRLKVAALNNGASKGRTFVMSLNEVTWNCARERRKRALWQSVCEARRHTVWTLLDREFMNKILDFCAIAMALMWNSVKILQRFSQWTQRDTRTHTCMHTRTHICTHTYTQAHARRRTHTRASTQAHEHTHPHERTHKHTHTHTHTHTNTHTHTVPTHYMPDILVLDLSKMLGHKIYSYYIFFWYRYNVRMKQVSVFNLQYHMGGLSWNWKIDLAAFWN
jgi:hypothetical protein